MARVTVEDCIDKVDNRFELVLLAGHRARLISQGAPITVDRVTAGLRVDVWDAVILKGEWLGNREVAGAIPVANDVITTSLVYSW